MNLDVFKGPRKITKPDELPKPGEKTQARYIIPTVTTGEDGSTKVGQLELTEGQFERYKAGERICTVCGQFQVDHEAEQECRE